VEVSGRSGVSRVSRDVEASGMSGVSRARGVSRGGVGRVSRGGWVSSLQ
jgi:hypothetical protein